MASTHEGVSCDNCMKSNFSGKRYKCLICFDFDLCSECYDQSIVNNSKQQHQTSNSSKQQHQKPNDKQQQHQTTANNTFEINNQQQQQQQQQNQHLNTHAMQCILTRSDHELYFGIGILNDFGIGLLNGSIFEQSSFTCPYCAKPGFSQSALCNHIAQQHASSETKTEANKNKHEVVCPICAVLPSSNGGDPNHLTDNLLQHIQNEHLIIASNKNDIDHSSAAAAAAAGNGNVSGSSSSSSSNAAAAAAAAALRFSRRLNYSQNTSRTSLAAANNILNATGSSGIINHTNSNTNRIGTSGTINRYAFQFGGGGGGSGSSSGSSNINQTALTSFMRSASSNASVAAAGNDSSATSPMDPIAELLSQLTGVRRAAQSAQSTNIQLQQLQAQLNRERESLQHQSAAAAAVIAAATNNSSSSSSAQSMTASSRGHHHHHHHLHHHLFGGGGSNPTGVGGGGGGGSSSLSKSQLLNSLAASSSKSNQMGSGGGGSSQNAAAAQVNQNAQIQTNAFTNQILELPSANLFSQSVGGARDSRFLLSKYDFSNIIDNTSVNLNSNNNNNNKNNKMVNQSLFINDIILSILSKQINNDTSNTNNTTINTNPTTTTNLNLLNDLPPTSIVNKNEDDLLIIDDFMEQQPDLPEQPEQENKFISSELMPS